MSKRMKAAIRIGAEAREDLEVDLVRTAQAAPEKMTLAEREIKEVLNKGSAACIAAYRDFEGMFERMVERETEIEAVTRRHVSSLKDKANQVGEALARIDRMMGTDFEAKLSRLERFAAAVETLDALDKNGRIAAIVKALS